MQKNVDFSFPPVIEPPLEKNTELSYTNKVHCSQTSFADTNITQKLAKLGTVKDSLCPKSLLLQYLFFPCE